MDIIGKSAFDFIHPDDISLTQQWFKKCIDAHLATSYYENRQIDFKGKSIYLSWRCSFNYNSDGSLKSVSGISRDITKIKQTEQELRLSKEKLNHLIQNHNAGVVVHDHNTEILIANEEASRVLGLTIDQMKGKTAIDPGWHFIHEDQSIFQFEEFPVNVIFATKNRYQIWFLA